MKAKDAVPAITNFSMLGPLATSNESGVTPMLVIGATNRLRRRRLQRPFSSGCCKNGTGFERFSGRPEDAAALEESFGRSVSEDRRENPAGTRHIRAIAVAEGFQHHSLFPGNAAKKQSPKTDQARETGNPVRQQ